MKWKIIAIVMLLITSSLFAQYERPGSSAEQALKIDVSARGAGMAGAYISMVKGAEATYYNPAVIAESEGTDIALNHNEWFAGINHEFMAITHNFGDYGAFGFSIMGLYADEMKVRTPLQPDGTGESFYAGSYVLGLTYARRLTDNVTFGGSVKYLTSKLYDQFTENVVLMDISANYDTGYRGHRFGLSITNFGQSIKYVNEEYPMPTAFTFGMSINALDAENYKLAVIGSATKPNDGTPLGKLGTEFNFMNMFFLRAGYNIGHDVAKYAFGLGAEQKLIGITLRLDYAYSDFSTLGAAHRLGMGFSF
jgi:hypothetical protein